MKREKIIMNNILRSLLWVCVLLPFSVMSQTAYKDDAQDFYVSDNAANDALEELNFVMCMMSAMGMDQMANRGKYKVSLYEDDCETADTSTEDAKKAQPQSAQSKENAKESTTAATTTEAKKVSTAIVEVTRADANAQQRAKVWFLLEGGLAEWAEDMPTAELANMATMGMNPYEPDVNVYIDARTTSGPSATSQFGEFDYKMSFTLDAAYDMCPPEITAEEKAQWGCEMPAGSKVGGMRIVSANNEVSFLNMQDGQAPQRSVISFSEDGTKVDGVTVDDQGWSVGDEWMEAEVVSAFSLDTGDAAVYCSKAVSARLMDFETPTEDGFPAFTEITLPHTESGLTADETCYSLKEADAQNNVWRYGVYNYDDESRAELTGETGFPMKATVTDGDGNPQEVHGYADYWYVHVDEEFASLVQYVGDAEPTVFTKEQFAEDTGPAATYTIAQSNQRLTKFTRSYLALNDLDKLTALMYMDNADGSYWETGTTALGFPAGNAEYEGSYDATAGSWSFTKKITWDPQWTETTLETPITFTNAQWITNMAKTESEGDCHLDSSCTDSDWQWTDNRSMWMWSPDTNQGYEISKGAMESPTTATAAAGILVDSSEELTPSDYPAKLACVFRCPSAATINATAQAAAALSSPALVVNPYVTTSLQYIKSGEFQGQWWNGVLASDVQTYTPSGLGILDSTSTAMGFASNVTEETIANGSYKNAPNDNWEEQLQWGIRTGRLIGGADDAAIQTELDKLECERSDNTVAVSADNPYRDTHPIFSATAKRLCDNAYWDGTGPSTWYELSFGASQWDRKRYVVDQSTAAYVDFSRPTTLYYEVPGDATVYGDDAGKSFRLDFGGFGDLWGIPGHVINVKTGESLGEWYNGTWSDNLRYVNRFIIEPHNGVDPVLTQKGSDTKYKVKALGGEQWLKLKASAIDSLTYSKTADNLPAWNNLVNIGPKTDEGAANPSSIGDKPVDADLINDGKPAIIHGELTMTF